MKSPMNDSHQNSTSEQHPLANKEGLRLLEERIGYRFRDLALLELALTHPSALNEIPRGRIEKKQGRDRDQSNQRLEFLGDSVLQLIFSEALYRLYPEDREGALSTKRFALVKGSTLSALAREIALYAHIRVGQSERTNTGSASEGGNATDRSNTGTTSLRDSILEDAFEALVAAIYLDSDLGTTREVVLRLYGDLSPKLAAAAHDTNPKGRLQERVQPLYGNDALHYETIATHGEAHAREFEVALTLHDQQPDGSNTSRRLLGTGRGSSKQRAEEAAARAALANWKDSK